MFMQRPGARTGPAQRLDAAIEEIKQHRQALGELLQFFRDARKGLLTEAEVECEVEMWHQLVEAGWQAVPGGTAAEAAVAELAPVPAATAVAAGTGPAGGTVVDESVPSGPPSAGPLLGCHAELPHPGSVVLEPPGPEDDERAVLLTAVTATVDGCEEVVWARLRGWGDVLVVAAAEPDRQATVVQELSAALPASVFPDAVVVGRRADLVHPLIEQVMATGRRVSAY